MFSLFKNFLSLYVCLFVCFVCAAIIISGSGYSISTTGFLSKTLDPPVREFQETELTSNK